MFRLPRSLVGNLTLVIGNATCCDTFKQHCKKVLNKGSIPKEIVHFWFNGLPTDDCRFDDPIFDLMIGQFRHFRDNKLKSLKFPSLPSSKEPKRISKASFLASYPNSHIGSQCLNNARDGADSEETTKDHVIGAPRLDLSANLLSFFSRFHFDQDDYLQGKSFRLWLTNQMQVNHRPIRENLIVGPPDKPGLLDLFVGSGNHSGFQDSGTMVLTSTLALGNKPRKNRESKHAFVKSTVPKLTGADRAGSRDRDASRELLDVPISIVPTADHISKLFSVLSVSFEIGYPLNWSFVFH